MNRPGLPTSNFTSSPAISENRNAFDTRVDLNLNDKNQLFYRFSYVDELRRMGADIRVEGDKHSTPG